MGKVFRIIGPPGTGKTTSLTHQIGAAVKKYGNSGVLVSSFTNTAAQELASRNPNMTGVGTLHHHAFNAIGKRRVAETLTAEFNTMFPRYKLSGGKSASEIDTGIDPIVVKSGGDDMLAKMNLLRAKLVPREMWPQNVRQFEASWSKFKFDTDSCDFTDMLELALRDCPKAPGDPGVIFSDEAQDSNPLSYALLKKWGKYADSLVVSGDADQCIFRFVGATPDTMMETVDDERVLSQSYRVPEAVHTYARRWVKQIKHRNDYEYQPRPESGFLTKANYAFNTPEILVKEVEQYQSEGKSCMILASCSYMLNGIISEMRDRGMVFSNSWRTSNGAWNPIKQSGEDSASTLDRILSFLRPCQEIYGFDSRLWTSDEFPIWAELIKSEAGIGKGMKKKLDDLSGEDRMPMDFLTQFFPPDTSFWEMFNEFTLDGAVRWFKDSVMASKLQGIQYPLRVIQKNGYKLDKPTVTLGTIHSVKGAEADVVFISPDISVAGFTEYTGDAVSRDSIFRLYYVALTRAREGVVLCGQSTPNAVRWI
jgi:DNA helicase-2/ATP-dependent DNA helicase PcrA